MAIERTRIGSLDGDGADVFGQIEAVELDGAGHLYVLDSHEHELRIFSPAGEHLRSVGREGGGPGEFASPVGLAWSPVGELWVIDPENQRVTILDHEGRRLRTARLPADFSLSPWPGRFDHEGRFYSYLLPTSGGSSFQMVRYDEHLAPLATLDPPTPPVEESFFEGREPRGSPMRARVPFSPQLVWRLSSRGEFWWAWTDEYRIFRERSGETVEIAHGVAQRRKVTAAERAAALERLVRFVDRGGVVDVDRIPTTKPPIASFFLDAEDQIWVLRSAGTAEAGSVLDVFSSEGIPLATVRLPFRLTAVPTPVIRNGHLAGVLRDEFGVQHVVAATFELPHSSATPQ